MTTRWAIDHGDCREVLRSLDENSVDACVTDPPYELGFMGKKWDSNGVAFDKKTWRMVLRTLKPGAHLLAFGGTRTYHRMVCAIEDAGFEVRDSLHWMYGTGFPKSLNVGDGRGTALKPSHEPIVMARKPLYGTVIRNAAQWGTGALNIDACRTDSSDSPVPVFVKRNEDSKNTLGDGLNGSNRTGEMSTQGRWPSNALFDENAAAELDAQSAGASRFFYVAKPRTRERNTGCAVANTHPTVKPVELMRHLVRLVTPPGGIVLDPFCGSGTTGIAALAEGLRFAGIEQSAEYVEIARQRITHAEREAA